MAGEILRLARDVDLSAVGIKKKEKKNHAIRRGWWSAWKNHPRSRMDEAGEKIRGWEEAQQEFKWHGGEKKNKKKQKKKNVWRMSTNLAYLEITIAGTKVVFPPCDPPQDLYTRCLKKKKKKIGPTNSRFSPLFDFANVRWLRSIEIDGTRKKFVLPIWDKWHFSNLSRDLPQFGKNTLHSRRSCVHARLWRVVFLLYLLHRSRLIKKWRSSSLRRMFRRA